MPSDIILLNFSVDLSDTSDPEPPQKHMVIHLSNLFVRSLSCESISVVEAMQKLDVNDILNNTLACQRTILVVSVVVLLLLL